MTGHLLQVLPSVLTEVDGELEIEFDSSESLRLYLDNFEFVTIACPVKKKSADTSSQRCRRVKDLPWREKLKLIPLPNAYGFREYLRHYAGVKRSLKAAIENANYLVFSPHTLLGDWPTVAVREAVKLKRPYTIEADVVYEKVHQIGWLNDPDWKKLIKSALIISPLRWMHHYCLRHSKLALLQGQDVYDAYAPFCENPHKVYHMPVAKDDYITERQLENKVRAVANKRPLRVCYVGRCIDMKGPMDWLKTLHDVLKDNVNITAVWLGDGPLLSTMRAAAENLGIAGNIEFRGHVLDRGEVFRNLRNADIFLFCHKTPESPRCLVEALASGCPLIGYGSAYPRDLVRRYGGGQFTAIGKWRELADILKRLAEDRAMLGQLIKAASASGRLYERDAEMQHRIDLIKEHVRSYPCHSRPG